MPLNFPNTPTTGDTYTYNGLKYTFDGSAWIRPFNGGLVNGLFYENLQTIDESYTISDGYNAMTAGPVTIANNVIVTVGTGETWTIV